MLSQVCTRQLLRNAWLWGLTACSSMVWYKPVVYGLADTSSEHTKSLAGFEPMTNGFCFSNHLD